MRKTTKRRLSDPQKRKAIEELRLLASKPATSVRSLERRMVKIYQQYGVRDMEYYAVECISDLRLERWSMLHNNFEWTDENITRLEAANEKMKEAMLGMRRKTIEVYESLTNLRTPDIDLKVKGTLWVNEMTFEGWNPDDETSWYLYDVMTFKPYCGFYESSINFEFIIRHDEEVTDGPASYDSENYVLYLEEEPDNWNELMPRDKTAHLHIIHGLHNLYDHCHWSLQDILGIKSYKTKIEVEYSPRNTSNAE